MHVPPSLRQRKRERVTNSVALLGGAGICLLACAGVELPLEGEDENAGTGATAGAAGTVSNQQGGFAGTGAGPDSAGESGSAGGGTGGTGAVTAGTGGTGGTGAVTAGTAGDGSEAGTGASAAS